MNSTASAAGQDRTFNDACKNAGGIGAKTVCEDRDPVVVVQGGAAGRILASSFMLAA